MDLGANAERFSGFADLYDRVRPAPPAVLGEVLRRYSGTSTPEVVDLGSGTGLSSRWAATWASTVVGVEPSDDMRFQAEARPLPGVRFVAGWSDATGLEAGSADVVLAVQALHWMEPTGTFAEAARLLRPGGVFAAIDCDFPPVVGSVAAEAAWQRCRATIRAYEARLGSGSSGDELRTPLDAVTALPAHFARDPQQDRTMALGVRGWSKDQHLERMEASGRFRFCRELVVHAVEEGDVTRFVELLRSQGDLQTLAKHGVGDELLGVDAFGAEVRDALGDGPHPFLFAYRVRRRQHVNEALIAYLDAFEPQGAHEVHDVERVRRVIAAGEPWDRALPLHVTASAVVIHPPSGRVLLRWHQRQQAWLQVGGHADPGETDPFAVASREAVEECGLTDLVAFPTVEAPALVQVVVVSVPPGKGEPAHEHADLRFVLATGSPDGIRAEDDGAPLRWLEMADARALTSEDNLRVALDRVAAALSTRDVSGGGW